jgi:transposase InsO family protein
MPWNVSGVVEKRREFVGDYESGDWSVSQLCRMYGISRVTGHELLRRWREGGEAALEERSRAPGRHPNQTPAGIEELVLGLRREHPLWGPRKLKVVLEQRHPERIIPAASTMGAMLDREGLTHRRRKRRRVEPYTQPFAPVRLPNDEWASDFKGWFRSGDGTRIDPLTISDSSTRYLLRCQAVEKTDTLRVKAVFQAAFREYGMPQAMRSDNGPPFASCGVAGLSRLSVWWIKLGIRPQRIQAGHPEQNGRHERMHRTLQQHAATPPQPDARAQQRAMDAFRSEYNQLRPHEALGMCTPASLYQPSPRSFPERLPEPEYGSAMKVRTVFPHGQFSWNYHDIFLGKALAGERIGLLPVDDRYLHIYLAWYPLARFDTQTLRVEKLPDQDRLNANDRLNTNDQPNANDGG